jgi:hypothetical protein
LLALEVWVRLSCCTWQLLVLDASALWTGAVTCLDSGNFDVVEIMSKLIIHRQSANFVI